MKVSVVGTGYVGLVSGTCLAEKGHQVICVDKDPEKVTAINRGSSPIYEAGLEELLKKNIHTKLKVTADLSKAIFESELTLIAVGTPFDVKGIDLTYIEQAAAEIGNVLKIKDDYHVVVVKSTVVPGTTDAIVGSILEQTSGKKAGVDFGLGVNPEFLREGDAVKDFMVPDRIVLGGIDEKTLDALERLYTVFKNTDKIRTTTKTAEMIKYTSNSLLATLISFSNEIGNLCSSLGGIDVVDVMQGVYLDRRLSPIMAGGERIIPSLTTYLAAGWGFGGSCFPKDVKALVAHGQKARVPMRLLEAVMAVNEAQPGQVLMLLNKHFPTLKGIRVAVLGLAFKAGTDDIRESPAIPIIRQLLLEGVNIKTYDPVALEGAKKILKHPYISYCNDLKETIEGAEAIILVTSWKEFEEIPELLRGMRPQPLIVDGRRMLNKDAVEKYQGIGM